MATAVEFATNIFYLNGAPLNLPYESMRHIHPIYNKRTNAMLFKFGRQTHKSTTVGYKITIPCLKFENYHSLYVAPTGNQVSVFSTDKLDSTLRESEVIQDHYIDTKTKDQISYKELTNGSRIYLRSAFHSADSIRGISADQTCIDEIQDICSDHIPVIEQCMSHSLAKWESLKDRVPNLPMHLFNCRIYAGTPKTIENTMERYWDQSTQNEWIIKCTHQGCKKYNYINEFNIGDTCLICNKCGKPIYYENGQWVKMASEGIIDSFRTPQIILNWINNINNPEAWKINVINTRRLYSTEKYFNEVLALPYANARHPLSVAEIKAVCEDYDMVDENVGYGDAMLGGTPLFAGIDWGKGDTASGTSYSILTIGGHIKGKFKTVFKKRYTGKLGAPLPQVEDMLNIIRRFRCVLTIADTGDGRTSNAMMVEALGPRSFGEIYEHGTMKQKIKWDGDKGIYIMNRTRIMTDLLMEIKREEVSFFKYEQFKEFQSDFTGIYADYSERTRLTKYDHNVPDDAFHSYMFARIASKIFRGEYAKYLTGASVGAINKDAISLG